MDLLQAHARMLALADRPGHAALDDLPVNVDGLMAVRLLRARQPLDKIGRQLVPQPLVEHLLGLEEVRVAGVGPDLVHYYSQCRGANTYTASLIGRPPMSRAGATGLCQRPENCGGRLARN